MGISNDEDLRLSESDAHETLPLYEEAHPFTGEINLPDSKATPDEVRDFLVQVLQSRSNIGIDHARRVAARWTRGTGRELRTYPVGMYQEIFGSEDAWAVYKEVRVLLYTQQAKNAGVGRAIGYAFIALLVCAVFAAIGVAFSDADEDLRIPIAFSLVITVPVLIGAVLIRFCGTPSPEDRAENELKNIAWHKAPAGPSAGS